MLNSAHILAASTSLALFLLQAISFYGWGQLILQLLGFKQFPETGISHRIWLGWAVWLSVLQALNLFLPLSGAVVIPTLLMGIIAVGYGLFKTPINDIKLFIKKRNTTLLISGLIFIIASIWISSRAMLPPTNYDSGLYHFSKIRWINEFPTVPGLGNLHGRLAFNQSFFTYVGALNFFPFFGHGRIVTNSFLFLLTLGTFLEAAKTTEWRIRSFSNSHPFVSLPAIYLAPSLIFVLIYSDGIQSPSPDLASTLLQFTIFLIFMQWLSDKDEPLNLTNYRFTTLLILAITAVTIKLSNLAFSSAVILLCIVKAKSLIRFKTFYRLAILSIVIILVWCVQGIILSGAPLFPSSFGLLAVEWAVPYEKILLEKNLIYAWARQPDQHWKDVLNNWNWFAPWFERLRKTHTLQVITPIVISITCLILTFILCVLKKLRWPNLSEWASLLPLIAGVVFWFFTAPDARFANGLFFMMPVCVSLIFLSVSKEKITRRIFLLTACLLFIIINQKLVPKIIASWGAIDNISTSGWHSVSTANLKTQKTSSGLLIYTPLNSNQCWDSPLPCTPRFTANLKLSHPGDLHSGFIAPDE